MKKVTEQSVGKLLQAGRVLLCMTLREVEAATGISNPYLSQLENDKIKKPSTHVLWTLSDLYKIDFNQVLAATGINIAQVHNKHHVPLWATQLEKEEERKLLEYLEFLRHKKRKPQ